MKALVGFALGSIGSSLLLGTGYFWSFIIGVIIAILVHRLWDN